MRVSHLKWIWVVLTSGIGLFAFYEGARFGALTQTTDSSTEPRRVKPYRIAGQTLGRERATASSARICG